MQQAPKQAPKQSNCKKEYSLYLDNRVFILVSKQTNAISTNQNRNEKANLRNK